MLKLLYKMFSVALEDQTNERDVPHASRRFITLLNALIKFCSAWAQMAPGRAVVYVFAQHLSLLLCLFALLCVFDFGNGEALLRFTSWEAAGSIWWGGRRKKKKQAQFPNQLLMSSREVQQQGADPGSCSECAAWPLYMQMAPRSQISFEVIKSLHCSLQKGGVLAAICQPDLSDYSLQLIAVPLKAFKAVNCSEIYCKHKNYE